MIFVIANYCRRVNAAEQMDWDSFRDKINDFTHMHPSYIYKSCFDKKVLG